MPLLVALVVNQVRRLLLIRTFMKKGMNHNDVAKKFQLHPFIAQKQVKAAAKFNTQTLLNAFNELADADYKMKIGIGGGELLESAIIKLCSS